MESSGKGESEEWSFVYVSDIHVGSPRSYRFQPAWNANWETARRQIVKLDPDFLVVGGDLTRDGTTHTEELVQVKTDLDQLPFPYHVIPGNHEVGNKYLAGNPLSINHRYLERYHSVFGESEWSFVHRGIRLTGFNSFLLGSGLEQEVSLRSWLESLTTLDPVRYHFFFLHPAVFIDSPDEADFDPIKQRTAWYFGHDGSERDYLLDIFRRTGASHVVSGHIHCRRQIEVNGTVFQIAPSTAFSQWHDRWPDGDASLGFLTYTFDGGKVVDNFVRLSEESTLEGYGPGGNPPEEGRDYSVAWEQPPLGPPNQLR